MNMAEAGLALKELREAKGWSQVRLAKEAGMSDSAIRNYERGARHDGKPFEIRPSHLRRLADAFGYPDGYEILRNYGESDMADQFEKEKLSGPDELGALTDQQRETLEELRRLFVQAMLGKV